MVPDKDEPDWAVQEFGSAELGDARRTARLVELARELARDKIRVNAVALTITSNTVGWDRMFANENFGSKLFAKAVARFENGNAAALINAQAWQEGLTRALRRTDIAQYLENQ